jgi:hypothetical protein
VRLVGGYGGFGRDAVSNWRRGAHALWVVEAWLHDCQGYQVRSLARASWGGAALLHSVQSRGGFKSGPEVKDLTSGGCGAAWIKAQARGCNRRGCNRITSLATSLATSLVTHPLGKNWLGKNRLGQPALTVGHPGPIGCTGQRFDKRSKIRPALKACSRLTGKESLRPSRS